ncbi:MAG: hypothetical protein AAGB04_31605 [Pseudomonadota bacterium]
MQIAAHATMAAEKNIATYVVGGTSHAKAQRAKLTFKGINHSDHSFIARVFVNQPDADENTPVQDNQSFLGNVYMYGHGSGLSETVNPLQPYDNSLYLAEEMSALLAKKQPAEITIVVVDNQGIRLSADLFKFESVIWEHEK